MLKNKVSLEKKTCRREEKLDKKKTLGNKHSSWSRDIPNYQQGCKGKQGHNQNTHGGCYHAITNHTRNVGRGTTSMVYFICTSAEQILKGRHQ